MDKLTELVLLLEERITLQDELHSLSKHGRDRHNLFIDEFHKKLGENQKRIAELKKELAPAAA